MSSIDNCSGKVRRAGKGLLRSLESASPIARRIAKPIDRNSDNDLTTSQK
jgi:hypothetical protein